MSKAMIIRDLLTIFKSGVDAVLPENLIRNSIKYNSVAQLITLTRGGESISVIDKNIHIVGTGKAVKNMAKELDSILNNKIKGGIISIPLGSLDDKCNTTRLLYIEGAKNNLPDTCAEATAKKVNDLAISLGKDDILLVLISGGGSSLLPMPQAPITLEEKAFLIKKLANLGADITQLNIVRKKLSDLKGGKLAMKAQPAKVVSLILSDIIDDPLDLIACGPTAENKDASNSAKDIIAKFNLQKDIPDSIKSILDRDDWLEAFPKDNVTNIIIGSNKISMLATETKATSLRWSATMLSCKVTGNVTDVANKYACLCKIVISALEENFREVDLENKIRTLNIPGLEPFHLTRCMKDYGVRFTDITPGLWKTLTAANLTEDLHKIHKDYRKGICFILGGEITVEVKGKGKGGRNQHLTLEFSNIINNMKDDFSGYELFLLSAGTDGIDGPTDAAGAIGFLDLVVEASQNNLNVQEYLDDNDSYNFYKNFNRAYHVVTGHTNTNVMDLHILMIVKKK